MNINDIKGTLVYALGLKLPDYKEITHDANVDDISEWLDLTFLSAKETKCNPFAEPVGCCYFQRNPTSKESKCEEFAELLNNQNFWDYLFKQEAILSTYSMIREMISDYADLDVTSTLKAFLPYGELCNTTTSENIYGLSYLLSNQNERNQKLAQLTKECKFLPIDEIHWSISYGKDSNLEKPTRLFGCDETLQSIIKKEAEVAGKNVDQYYKELSLETLRQKLNKKYSQDNLNNEKERALALLKTSKKVMQISSLCRGKKEDINYKDFLNLHNLEFYQVLKNNKGHNLYPIRYILRPQIQAAEIETAKYTLTDHQKMVTNYLSIIEESKLPGLCQVSNNSERKKKIETKFDLSDKVYLRYKMEQAYSIELIDTLYEIINTHTYSVDLKNMVDIIADCCLLPNPFTRRYILQAAVDNLHYNNIRVPDYGDISERVGLIADKDSIYRPRYTKVQLWKKSYSDMIQSLRNYVFPVFNSVFFVSLWEDVRKTVSSDKECAVVLFTLLTKYLNSEKHLKMLLSPDNIYAEITGTKNDKIKPAYPVPFQSSCQETTSIDLGLYLQCARAVSSKRKTYNDSPALIDSKYIEEMYKFADDNPRKALYRVAKKYY